MLNYFAKSLKNFTFPGGIVLSYLRLERNTKTVALAGSFSILVYYKSLHGRLVRTVLDKRFKQVQP